MSAVRERPILFSGPMVKAILEGRKTQTRRVVDVKKLRPSGWTHDNIGAIKPWDSARWKAFLARWPGVGCKAFDCPYGQRGERLWVREAGVMWPHAGNDGAAGFIYKADGQLPEDGPKMIGRKWTSPIHMPRSLARITLEITAVRVERLHDITAHDCMAEGIEPYSESGNGWRMGFQKGWDRLNSKRGFGWDTNPWVWVVEFKRA